MTCPDGHTSASEDYCDVCGAAMSGPDPAAVSPVPAGTCANCGAPLAGRFCEVCGHDATAPVPDPAAPDAGPSPTRLAAGASPDRPDGALVAVVRADRAWYDAVRERGGPDAGEVGFPPYCPERRFALVGDRLAIGRRSRGRGTRPDIDLSGPPLDPGISAQQAMLLGDPDGGWRVVDLDSTNGTVVARGGSAEFGEPIPPGEPVELAGGDRIHLGAWTTITLTRATSAT
ncbi:hypothetical protein GCM10023321_01930 [Pseudonocardia eucalypti]|uniref:FHA domain-containing protein n=1 Tax=Pseudonocardia eucalypti TaxID=648755 RepID=A0ABP9PH81_9PSEU|nr:rRNA maturation protein Nop10 [Pseudonocardia eucalypti]